MAASVAEQPDHHPGPDRRLARRQGHLGRDDDRQRGARGGPLRAPELTAVTRRLRLCGARRRPRWPSARHGQAADAPGGRRRRRQLAGDADGAGAGGDLPDGEPRRRAPAPGGGTPRRVTLTRAFRIAATEVTQKQWLALMPSNRSPQQGDDLPVTSVSWTEAQEFCLELSQKEGRHLPPADRGGVGVRLPGGRRRCAGRPGASSRPWPGTRTTAKGRRTPSGRRGRTRGAFTTCSGTWPSGRSTPTAPTRASRRTRTRPGPPPARRRVVRGGSWRSFPPALRCAARAGTPESYQLPHVGLRVVADY